MDIKKLAIATIASFVTMFLLGYLGHVILLADFFANNPGKIGDVSREPMLLEYIALGTLVLAFMMSYIYPKGVESSNTIKEGLKFGVIIGIIWIVPHTTILYGVSTIFSKTFILGDSLWHLFEQGMGGVVIAMVYGKGAGSNE